MTTRPANLFRLQNTRTACHGITGFILRVMLVLTFMCMSGAFSGSLRMAHAEFSSLPESQVKAAFLYSFIKFVEWPSYGSANVPSTLCLGILGKDTFGDAIETVRGKNAKGRKIVIMHFRRIEDVKDCEVLFISASERGRLVSILKHLKNSSVLTVADQEGFCEAGGMINLTSNRNRISFEINVAAISRARLHISSQLLKLARIINE